MAGEKLVSAMKSVADNAIPYTELTNSLYGEVVSINPLTIKIENRFEVSEKDGNLQISPLCKENPSCWRGLLAGDKVLVLRVASGNEYIVLYRLSSYSQDKEGGYK